MILVKWELESGENLVVGGGGLTADYDLVQFHIHWGTDNSKGSEHTLNGRSFPMEVCIVYA